MNQRSKGKGTKRINQRTHPLERSVSGAEGGVLGSIPRSTFSLQLMTASKETSETPSFPPRASDAARFEYMTPKGELSTFYRICIK